MKGHAEPPSAEAMTLYLSLSVMPIYAAVVGTVEPMARPHVVRLFSEPQRAKVYGLFVLLVCALVLAEDLLQRVKGTSFDDAVQTLRSFGHGLSVFMGALLYSYGKGELAGYLPRAELIPPRELFVPYVGLGASASCLSFFLCASFGLPRLRLGDLHSYSAAVSSREQSYEFVIGRDYPEDEKLAEEGPSTWSVLPEKALWTNLLVLGGIGSGKTASVAYPFMRQALGKFPEDPSLRPSLLVLDLKGDTAKRVFELSKKAGREEEFYYIAPSPLLDEQGMPLIPEERRLCWNPAGGSEPPDVRAHMLADAFEAVRDGTGGLEYFKNVQYEFLAAALSLFDAVYGPGKLTLLDLYHFALKESVRAELLKKAERAKGDASLLAETALAYFRGKFGKLKADERSALISGLTAQLSKIATPTLKETFCPEPSSGPSFEGTLPLLVERPGIVVFSVDESTYSQALARLLGVAFLRRFQTEMLRRSTAAFAETGGNTERLVACVVDECWAYMNPQVAAFTAVSRQARCFSLFLTQSLDQIRRDFRDTVIGNFRTKLVLSLNDPLTLRSMSDLLGETVKEEVVLFSSKNQSKRGGGLAASASQGLSEGTSVKDRLVPRYSMTDIQHLPPERAVLHMFDGRRQRVPKTIELCPYYKPEFSLAEEQAPTIAPAEPLERPSLSSHSRDPLVSILSDISELSCG